MSFTGKRTSADAVSNLNPKAVHSAVPYRVPFGLGGSPMGRILAPCPLLYEGTAVLQLCNGLCEIGDDFCLLLLIVSFFWMEAFAKLSSNTAIFSAGTISCGAA